MSDTNGFGTSARSEEDMARMIIRVAEMVEADAIICVTERGAMAQYLHRLSDQVRVIAATTNGETFTALTEIGLEAIRLPLRTADRYNQVRHVISVALRAAKVALGDFVVCVFGYDLYPNEGDFAVLTSVEPSLERVVVTDLVKLTDGIRPTVLEVAVSVACKIGRAARRGKRIGTIFMLGDSLKVLEGSKQLIPNPFHGHDDAMRRLTNPDIHYAIIELSKLDGAFVIRGDGFIQTAGTFLVSASVEIDLPAGLGARHAAAAAVTARSAATAIVVSATDGNVRVFSGGRMVLQMDPDVPDSPFATGRQSQ